MSNDIQKADQIAYRFYTKLTLVVNNARSTADPPVQTKTDKWFNLETPDSDLFKDHLRIYRSTVSVSPHPPPFELQVLLSIPELAHNQVLVHLAPDSSRLRIEPTPSHILLESWRLSFNSSPYPFDDQADVVPSTIYKHGIPLFRSLYSLLRILPAWKVFKRLRRWTGALKIHLQVPALVQDRGGVLGFNAAPAHNATPLAIETHGFPSVPHPMGTLSLSVTYLTTPNFQLDDLESLLSSRFLSLDTGPEFTPTLAKNQQRDSFARSRGSLPTRMPLPQKSSSPPSNLADRFVLPSRVASLGLSPRNAPLPLERSSSANAAESNAVPSAGSSAYSKEGSRSPSGLAARLRKESLVLTSGSDLPSIPPPPSPLPIRRPNINPVHPFKASTLSSGSPSHHSSSSLRQPSPLSSLGMPSLPSRPAFPQMPAQTQTSPTSARFPHSIANRPSPPFTPSSLGDRRSLTSVDGDRDREEGSSPRLPPRKRYSSSFGHRYTASGGAGSEGSAGSGGGERRDSERVGNASFLSTNTDDDDISVFVQDIDARKPLSGRYRSQSGAPSRDEQGTFDGERGTGPNRDEEVGSTQGNGEGRSSTDEGSSAQGPMLTSEVAVDERLRQMNATFIASLEGLSSGRRERKQSESGEDAWSSPSTGSPAQGEISGSGSGIRGRRMHLRPEGSRRPRTGGESPSSAGSGGSKEGRTATAGVDVGIGGIRRGNMLLLTQHSPGSGSPSESYAGAGSEEVIGRLELDDGQSGVRQQ